MNDQEQEGTGVEAEISTQAFESDPVLTKYQTDNEQAYWTKEIDAAKRERKNFNDEGVRIIKRYASEQDQTGSTNVARSEYNIFFANTEIKQAALYARTPKPDVSRRFDDPDDQASRVASLLLERNISYELECENFDATFKDISFDRLVPGIGIGWLRLEQEQTEPEYQTVPHPFIPGAVATDETGAPLQGPMVPGSDIGYQLACIDHVAWNDFLWAPCRVWKQCRWVGRKVPMNKDALHARFDGRVAPDVLRAITFSTPSMSDTGTGQVDPMRPKNVTEPTTDIYELWDKERRLIFWFSEGASTPLDVQSDTNDFDGFFPTPLPPLCRYTTSNTTPVSDFHLVRPQYNELDALNLRATNLINALQLKWGYDSANAALKTIFTTGKELEGTPIKDWAVLQSEKGGLAGSMEFIPLQQIASTYQELIQAREQVKAQINEVEGINDFLRGVQQPYVTATAAGATNQASSSRMSIQQQQVADYIQRLLRLKAHLICKFYKPENIVAAAGTLAQADQQYIPAALQLLKDKQMSHFRLEISVDSIQLPNQSQEKAEANEFLQAFSSLMGQVLPMVQQNPATGPLALAMTKFVVSKFKGAAPVEGAIDAALAAMQQAAQTNQGQPPKPSPDEVKAQASQQAIQAQIQQAQMDNQTKLQIAQMDTQLKAQKLQIDALVAQTNAKKVDASIAHDTASIKLDALDAAHSNALGIAGLVATDKGAPI